jgi:long-subunit fatty acid transport protein
MEGTGYNFKIGAIYKPVQNIRLGLAFHSPTWYDVKERSLLAMDSQLAENHSNYGVNHYDYDFSSPMKVVLSGAVLFNKRGLISVDTEYMDYSDMRFRRGGNGTDNFNDLNSEMGNVFENVLNLRIGGEYKLTNQFTVRAGYELYGNPYKNTITDVTTLTDDMSKISAGFGYAVNAFSLNFAYTNTVSDYSESSVLPNYYQMPRTNNNHNILMSLGFKF